MANHFAKVHSIETMGTVDGPGIRFVIFLQGCLMRCQYCHNPDTWTTGGGAKRSAIELSTEALRYKDFWGNSGGVTVSGGEPLMQIDFLIEFFTLLKKENIHTTLDTCGACFANNENFLAKLDKLLFVTDLVLLDIKHIDDTKHHKLTGMSNQAVLNFAKYLSCKKQTTWIRHVLVPTVTDDESDLKELAKFIQTLSNVEKIEVIPYHTLGLYKWEALGIDYPLKNILPPTDAEVKRAIRILNNEKYFRGVLGFGK